MKLFISYSHADKDFAFKIFNTLSTSGIEVFIDDKDIKVGESILERIEEGIEESTGLLYIISNNSIHSSWVKDELNMARIKYITSKKNFIIYPLLIDNVDLPLSISHIKYADFRDWSINEKYYSEVSLLFYSLGIGNDLFINGKLGFVVRNYNLLNSLQTKLSKMSGLTEGLVDMYYLAKVVDGKMTEWDLTHRLIKKSRNLCGNILSLLEELQNKITEDEHYIDVELDKALKDAYDAFSNVGASMSSYSIVYVAFEKLANKINGLLVDSFNESTAMMKEKYKA